MNEQPLNFNGTRRAPALFQASQNQTMTELLCYELDLSTARTFTGTGANAPAIINLAGNSWFIDQDSDVGNAYVLFNDRVINAQPRGVFMQPGSIMKITANQLTIVNTAQASKKLRIWYGVDIDFTPALALTGTSNVNVTNASLTVTETGTLYGASYKSNTLMAANTPDTVFAPAANVNGAIIWHAQFLTQNAATIGAGYLAKTAAPANITDGDLILSAEHASLIGANQMFGGTLPRPLKIAAGKGLYYLSTTAEVGAGLTLRSVLYTLL